MRFLQLFNMIMALVCALLAAISPAPWNIANALASILWALRSAAFVIAEAMERQRPANTTPTSEHNPVPEERIIK